jgi:hypothetical protein
VGYRAYAGMLKKGAKNFSGIFFGVEEISQYIKSDTGWSVSASKHICKIGELPKGRNSIESREESAVILLKNP